MTLGGSENRTLPSSTSVAPKSVVTWIVWVAISLLPSSSKSDAENVGGYCPGARSETDFCAAWSISSAVSRTLMRALTRPLAPTVTLTAAADTLSANSMIVTTSSAPKAK